MFLVLLLSYVVLFSFGLVCDPKPGTPTLIPFGESFGINPGRVAWYYDRNACSWDGSKLHFLWKYLNQTDVDNMVSKSLLSLTSTQTEQDAWNGLFVDFNKRKHGLSVGYKKGEKIAIKLNLNVAAETYTPLYTSNSVSPTFFKSVLRSLILKGGVAEEDITAFDAARWIQKQFWDAPYGIEKEFPNVNLRDVEGGEKYVKKVEVDFDTMMYFSDPTVASQNTTKFPKCLTAAKYVIQINAFRGHTLAGITETGKNWFGSIYRPDITCDFIPTRKVPGHWCPASLHKFVNVTGEIVSMGGGWLPQRPMGVYNPLVDLMGHDDLSNKGLVFFTDATYGGQSQSPTSSPVKFEMKPFNGDYSCSAFASQDPIAMDSVLFDFLRSEPVLKNPKIGCVDNYLHEASLLPNPPSKVRYAPAGKILSSMGVHEHWNNENDKEYSKNLGTGDGIELIKVHEL